MSPEKSSQNFRFVFVLSIKLADLGQIEFASVDERKMYRVIELFVRFGGEKNVNKWVGNQIYKYK